jgi:hypothetical protein
MTELGWTTLYHGRHFIWLDEKNNDPYRRKAVELEENLRRKDLSWQEQVMGKEQLLKTMISIHGPARMGTGKTNFAVQKGFGVISLAAMLGETPQGTSKDLQIAAMVRAVPSLANEATKAGVLRKFKLIRQLGQLHQAGLAKPQGETLWKLYGCDFRDVPMIGKHYIENESVDLVYTDLPFGIGLNKQFRHEGAIGYEDNQIDIIKDLKDIAEYTYMVLRPDRFSVFWFGFNYYYNLCCALRAAGLHVHDVPFIWHRPGLAPTQNPYTMYGNQYDPAIICWKGNPQFIRPGAPNVVSIPSEQDKLYNAQQPLDLVKKFILDMTLPGATIVDFMCGSGTTGIAATQLGRRSILFEKNPAAITIARSRLEAL